MAAQSLMLYMQKIGLDVGYIDRTKRYLSRANQLHPEDERVIHLASLIKELERGSEVDWGKLSK